MELKHEFLNLLDNHLVNEANEIVKRIKINKTIDIQYTLTAENIEKIEQVVGVYEIAISDLWSFAFSTEESDIGKKKNFHALCKETFDLLQYLPLPQEPIEKIKQALKLLTYSYLGEKWEDMKRLLDENDFFWNVPLDQEKNWDARLFMKTYLAILHLTRKKSWNDLNMVSQLIVELRTEQQEFEKTYLESIGPEYQQGSALELASFYHLAKSVELIGQYMLQGTPNDILDQLNFHFDKAITYCQGAKVVELDLILRMLNATFRKMIQNSVWTVARRINSRVTKFIKLITEDETKPVFELLYPQRVAILEKGLLDPTSRAIVVNLPTSSGKTIIAEFRILQALNQFAEEGGKIAYVVPTKALVNQITSRLRRELGRSPLNIKVEKMSGALEIDPFENNLLNSNSLFDILVTTPEKLNLLIRHPEKSLAKSLVLIIIDEAHNLADGDRGVNLEMLLSNIKKDCDRANLLLLTPLVPNGMDVAKWLDPDHPKSITVELDWWQPNDKVIGLYYPDGKRNHTKTCYKPLATSRGTIDLQDEFLIGELNDTYSLTELRSSNYFLTAIVASQLLQNQSILVLAGKIATTWKIAKELYSILPNEEIHDDNIELVSKFVASELGEDFPLVSYLKKRIGVHSAGLPDDIRELMEWLMEIGSLRILVATTTIAQGMNFPVSAILLSTYSHREGKMPPRDFWNLVGRAGRIDQRSVGLVGIAVNSKNAEQAKEAVDYVQKNLEDLVSVLKQMIEKAITLSQELDLTILAREPAWSSFVQYISHMYYQSKTLQNFSSELEMTMRRTYAYNQLDRVKKQILINAVKQYAQKLDNNKHLAPLSDLTGFSPDTIYTTIGKISALKIPQSEWTSSRLFSSESTILTRLVGIMLYDIPETRKNLSEIDIPGTRLDGATLSKIIGEWVSGKSVTEISKKYFKGEDTTSITKCVTAIYSKIVNSATWGLAGIQKMAGIDFEKLSAEETMEINNLPAMIYYGVKTSEAILMRMNSVPRSISSNMGTIYKDQITSVQNSKSPEIMTWLKSLADSDWNKAVPQGKNMSGMEYKKIWEKLSGVS
ncbi:MAG: DEAD/DEAH box helicase [Candidatus Nitrosotalea sp.]|nr:DEAD/DEAH box helicase [Candidatus Nitrosotalea sp.]